MFDLQKTRQFSTVGRPLRVLAIGDCNTCGITVPPVGNTIVDKFCELLEAAGYAPLSQNLGYGMTTTREGVELMRREAKPADVVLINYGLVDTWITSIPQFYIPYYPETRMRRRLRKLLKIVKRRLRYPLIRKLTPTGPVVSIEEYSRNIREIIHLARSKRPGADILLWGSPPVLHDPQRNANLARYDQRLELIAADVGGTFVSTVPILKSLDPKHAYVDAVHLNEVATSAIAAQLALAYQATTLAAAG